jgi:hypothetical protein
MAGIREKAAIVLDRLAGYGENITDRNVIKTGTTEKYFWNVPF